MSNRERCSDLPNRRRPLVDDWSVADKRQMQTDVRTRNLHDCHLLAHFPRLERPRKTVAIDGTADMLGELVQ